MHNSGQTSEDYIKQVLGLPENLVVECMIAFGYPDEDKEPVAGEQLEYWKKDSLGRVMMRKVDIKCK